MTGPESTIDCNFKLKMLKKPGGFETGNTPHQWDYAKLRAADSVLAEYKYEKHPVLRGYAGRTLYVNLTRNEIAERPVSEEMKQQFTGGKGFDLMLMYRAIKPTTRCGSDENECQSHLPGYLQGRGPKKDRIPASQMGHATSQTHQEFPQEH